MEPIRNDHPLRRLFSGLIEHAFCAEVGLCDPALTQYLADLLVDFTYVERFSEIDRAQGRRLEQIATLLAVMSDEEPQSATERERAVYRHIGDYTLARSLEQTPDSIADILPEGFHHQNRLWISMPSSSRIGPLTSILGSMRPYVSRLEMYHAAPPKLATEPR